MFLSETSFSKNKKFVFRRTNGVHFECLIRVCYTCGCLDHPLPSLEADTDLKELFRTSKVSSFFGQHGTGTKEYTHCVISSFS